jgi:MraZ protein
MGRGGAERGMTKFVSHYEKAIDAKGRVSIPPAFRSAIGGQGDRLFCFPSFVDAALEAYGEAEYFGLLERIEGIVETPEAREQLEFAVITRCSELTLDGEGRIVLPERMLREAGIEKAAIFAGRGNRFQIWAPSHFAAHEAAAMGRAREYRHLLLVGGKPRIPQGAA